MANQPDIIPKAWAANNSTADSIPETTSESGKASWDQGFPVETSLPLSQGGVPPKYGDFNGILKILSQFALFAQAGGQYAWSNALAYGVGSIVLGTDGNLYRAAQESTAVNPVGDASGKWEMLSNLVHKIGNETITGTKIFEGLYPILQINRIVNDAPSQPADIRFSNNNINEFVIRLTVDNNIQLGSRGSGSAWYEGPMLSLNKNNTFFLQSGYGSSTYKLQGSASGSLSWAGQPIQTSSDERLKADFSDIPDCVLDAWGDVQWSRFKFRAAKEAKGESARWHTGLVAQRVKQVFEEKGLDACEYGILCHEVWQDEYEERENGSRVLVRAAGEMWTIRYEEALCMEAAYQRHRADRAEARIAALESRLNEMEAVIASLIAPVGDETYAGTEEGEAQA